jgi:hypothetical protein
VLFGRIGGAFGDSFADGLMRIDNPNENEAAGTEAAITGLSGHLDQLTGVGVAGRNIWDAPQESGIGYKATQQLPDGSETHVRRAVDLSTGLSASLSANGTPDDKEMAGFVGLWEMLRNVERLLPQQGIAVPRDGGDAAAAMSEGAEPGLGSSLVKLLARDDVHDLDQEVSNMPAERITSGGGRNGPTGHKNDPIYTIAISQATGTLMPMVPTSGTSTRSPPIPGQRNLP